MDDGGAGALDGDGALQALAESDIDERTFLEKAFQHNNDAVLLIDPDAGAIREANRRACELLGYEYEELTGMAPSRIHSDEAGAFEAFVDSVMEEGRGRTDEVTCLRRDGTAVPAEIAGSMIGLDDHPYLLALLRDRSREKHRRERLATLTEASRRLVRADSWTEIAQITVDIAEEVLDHELTVFWRYDPESDVLVPAATTDTAERMARESVEGSEMPRLESDTYEMEVFRDGDPVVVEDYQTVDRRATDAPLRSLLMIPIGEHGVLHVGATERRAISESERYLIEILAKHAEAGFDRTDRLRELRRQETELSHQNERLQEFASVVSHDLRNPLQAAMAQLSIAQRDYESEHLDNVAAMHDRMADLIDDLLTLARQGDSIGDTEPVWLEEIATEAWSHLETEGADMTVADGTGSARFRADRSRLMELFENLYRNAVEHAGPAVAVRVGTLPDDHGFYVEDDGPGIPEAERDAVFESGYSTADDGTGFGLPIVRRIAEAHGWSVSVTDGTEGGARFEVRTPESGRGRADRALG